MPAIRTLAMALLLSPSFLAAKPLVTSSEDNVERLCLAREDEPGRVVRACDQALAKSALTMAQRVELLIARGDALLWQDRLEQSVESFRAALGLDPQSVEAWNGLGWALWEFEDERAAHEAFEQSMNLDVSVQGLAGSAATARRTGTISNDHAREMLEASLSIDPDYIWAVREIAWSYLEERNFDAAARKFESALDIEPADLNARFGLGRANLGMGEVEAALELFNGILIDAPDDFPAQVYRIMALRTLDRNAQALRSADRMIASYPDRASGYIERGKALLALERRREAIETYRRAESSVGPNNAIIYWHADALTFDGRFEEALDVIERGLSLDGADYSDHLLRSYIALELKRYPLAKTAAEEALATGIDDPWAHYYIAITLIHSGETQAGISRFARAMEVGLPEHRVGAFASELISAGKYVEAAQLRLKY